MDGILKKLGVARKNLEMLERASSNDSKEDKLKKTGNRLKDLYALSGTEDFQTIQIRGSTIPEIWCPEIRPKITVDDLPTIPLDQGGTGADSAEGARANLGLGTLSTQDTNDVNITGGSITVDGQFNTGLDLSSNSYSTAKISIRSPLINFKNQTNVPIFTVPNGYFFLIDEMEVVTLSINSPSEPPIISFGNTDSSSEYYGPTFSKSNISEFRHVIKSPQNAITQNTTVTFSVLEGSTASSHSGFGIIMGYLISAV